MNFKVVAHYRESTRHKGLSHRFRRECCSGHVSTQQRVDHDTSILLEV